MITPTTVLILSTMFFLGFNLAFQGIWELNSISSNPLQSSGIVLEVTESIEDSGLSYSVSLFGRTEERRVGEEGCVEG